MGIPSVLSVAGVALCGAVAALVMTLVTAWAGMVTAAYLWAIAGAALAGMFLDSLLGATLEHPGGLNNDAVNLLGTLSAALLAWWWVR